MLVLQASHFLLPFEEQNCCPSGDPLGGRLDYSHFVTGTLPLNLEYGFLLNPLPLVLHGGKECRVCVTA